MKSFGTRWALLAKGSMEPGGGGRFARLKRKLAKRRDVRDPGALAAWIGRRKYGNKRFQEMAAAGKALGAADFGSFADFWAYRDSRPREHRKGR
jgi:hypothetical protein